MPKLLYPVRTCCTVEVTGSDEESSLRPAAHASNVRAAPAPATQHGQASAVAGREAASGCHIMHLIARRAAHLEHNTPPRRNSACLAVRMLFGFELFQAVGDSSALGQNVRWKIRKVCKFEAYDI
jgi:hypothetical protein